MCKGGKTQAPACIVSGRGPSLRFKQFFWCFNLTRIIYAVCRTHHKSVSKKMCHFHDWPHDWRTPDYLVNIICISSKVVNDLGHFWLGYIMMLGHPQMSAHLVNFDRL